jgi:Uncharacterized protein conserved in bacteria
MFDVWNFIVTNVFRNPPVLIGVIAAIGLILQKKKIEDVFKGAILAAMGLYMLVEGTNFISSSITPINMVFRQIAGVEVPQGLDAASFMTAFGSECGMAMFIGLILHLCIARFTPIKTVLFFTYVLLVLHRLKQCS